MRLVVGVVMLWLAVGFAAADKLILKDGQVVTGEIVAITNADVRIKTDKETMRVPRWAIERVERQGADGKTKTVDLGTPETRTAPQRGSSSRQGRAAPEATPALMAWIDVCVEHLGSEDEGVRMGAASALRAAGPAAKSALEKAADDENAVKAQLARRVLGQVTRYEARLAERTAGRPARGTPQARPLAALGAELGLSPEQESKFNAVIDEYYTKQEELSNAVRARTVDLADAGTRASQLRKDCDRKLGEFLTPDQMQRFSELSARRRGTASR